MDDLSQSDLRSLVEETQKQDQPSQDELKQAITEGADVRGPYAVPASPTVYTFSMEGMRSFGLRTKLGFGEGPQQKLDILRANGVDATLLDGDIHYLDPATKEVKKIQETNFSIYDINHIIGKAADVVGDLPELGGMVAGGAVGGAVGAASPVPGGAVMGGALLSSAGAMGGKQAKIDLARSFGANISEKENLQGVAGAGIGGLIADPAGRVIAKVVEKIAAPFASKVVAGFKDAQEVMGRYKDAQGRPLHVTAGQAVGGSMLENVAKSAFIGSGEFKTLHASQEAALDQAIKTFAKDLSGANFTKEEQGALYKDAIERRGGVYRSVERRLYGEVDKAAEGARVDVSQLRAWAADSLAGTSEARELAPSIAGKSVETTRQALQDKIDTLIKNKAPKEKIEAAKAALEAKKSGGTSLVDILSDLSALPDKVSFTTFQTWSASLAALSRGGPNKILNDAETGIIKEANRRLNMAAEEAGKTLQGKDAWTTYQTARRFSKEWREVFDNKLVNTLVNADPQKFASLAFRPNQIEGIRAVRKAIGPGEFNKVKGAWMASILKPEGIEDVSASALSKRVAKWDDPTVREILNKPGELLEFTKLVNAAKLTADTKGGPGSVAMQLTQPGVLLQAVGLGVGIVGGATMPAHAKESAALGGAILLGPKVIAKIFATPTGVRWMTEAFTAKAGTAQATRATAAVLAIAYKGEGGIAPDDLRVLSQKEAALLTQRTEKARKFATHLQNLKEGIPLTSQQESEVEQAYPGATKMSVENLNRVESYTR